MINKLLNTTILIVALCVVSTLPVYAQGVFDVNPNDTQTQVSVKLPEIEFGQQNEYFSAILTLQKQIALIKKLIEREKEISKISKSYNDMNASFKPSAPERDWCEQIPPNAVCHGYYKDMYKNYSSNIDDKKNNKQNLSKAQDEDSSIVPPTLNIAKSISEQTEEEKQATQKSKFAWTQITCFSSLCKAIISPFSDSVDGEGNPTINEQMSYTVHNGDILPSGVIVHKISASGVKLMDNGKEITMDPAPLVKVE